MSDSIVTAVKADLDARAARGFEKYGTDMDRTDLSRKEWMQHAYEEALDHALYLRKLIEMEGGNDGANPVPARFGCHVDRIRNGDAVIHSDCVIDVGKQGECTFSGCGDKLKCQHWREVRQ